MPRVIRFGIAVDKPDRAIAFYKKVFGWQIRKASGPMDYCLVKTGPAAEHGIDGGHCASRRQLAAADCLLPFRLYPPSQLSDKHRLSRGLEIAARVGHEHLRYSA